MSLYNTSSNASMDRSTRGLDEPPREEGKEQLSEEQAITNNNKRKREEMEDPREQQPVERFAGAAVASLLIPSLPVVVVQRILLLLAHADRMNMALVSRAFHHQVEAACENIVTLILASHHLVDPTFTDRIGRRTNSSSSGIILPQRRILRNALSEPLYTLTFAGTGAGLGFDISPSGDRMVVAMHPKQGNREGLHVFDLTTNQRVRMITDSDAFGDYHGFESRFLAFDDHIVVGCDKRDTCPQFTVWNHNSGRVEAECVHHFKGGERT